MSSAEPKKIRRVKSAAEWEIKSEAQFSMPVAQVDLHIAFRILHLEEESYDVITVSRLFKTTLDDCMKYIVVDKVLYISEFGVIAKWISHFTLSFEIMNQDRKTLTGKAIGFVDEACVSTRVQLLVLKRGIDKSNIFALLNCKNVSDKDKEENFYNLWRNSSP
ncbi:Uncharacterized protein Fot_00262 [Forsythia ovata]|uniref:Uncharacterized protein n=1 Tax=Forsythia ovata TaxID=205694 RepID=A0ABD1X0N2_9LAMI